MLATLAAWAAILVVCGLAGTLILSHILERDEDLEPEDLFILSQWLGLFALAAILLALSLIWPLTPPVTLTLAILVGTAAIGQPCSRSLLLKGLNAFRRLPVLLSLFSLAVVCALYVSQVIYWGDTGGYHFSLVRWLSEYGLVPGLALLHDRFGFSSSWFTLTAVWNHGQLAGRSGALMGGYALWLMLAHWGFSLARCASGKHDRAAWFVVVGNTILFPLLWRWGGAISPSPDIPVMALGVLAGAALLNPTLGARTAAWLLLTLAATAFNMKLAVLPLLSAAWLFAMLTLSGRGRIWVTLIAALSVLPVLVANGVTSGYPLYPSPILALDVPWRLDVDSVRRMTKIIFDFAFYGLLVWDQPALQPTGFLAWLVQWSTSRLEWPTALLLVGGLGCLIHLIYRRSMREPAVWKVSLVAVIGIGFFMLTAPTLRFGISWLLMLPAIWVAVLQPAWVGALLSRLTWWIYTALIVVSLSLAIWLSPSQMQEILYRALNSGQVTFDGSARINLIVPPEMPNVSAEYDEFRRVKSVIPQQVEVGHAADFDYFVNKGYCWNLPLPCGHNVGLALLRPEKGIAGGFVQKSAP